MRNRRPFRITLCDLLEVMLIQLPSFGVVLAETLTEILIPARGGLIIFLVHVNPFWILFEVGDIVCCVATLEDCVCCL